MRFFNIAITVVLALETVDCLTIPEIASSGSIPAIFGRTAPKCTAGTRACDIGACPKIKTVLQSMPPAVCPPPTKKPTTKTQRAIGIVSNLSKRAKNGIGKPKKSAPPACSPTPTPASTKPTKPTKPKPCTGTNCKREYLGQNSTSSTQITDSRVLRRIKRATADFNKRVSIRRVDMDDAKVYNWGPGDEIETSGISFCSVLVVYTKSKVGMAHIPQSRAIGYRYISGEDVVNDLTSRLSTAFGSMAGATAVLYHHSSLDEDRIKQIRDWIRAQGAIPNFIVFGQTIPGSGVFVIRRFGDAWPPYISPPL